MDHEHTAVEIINGIGRQRLQQLINEVMQYNRVAAELPEEDAGDVPEICTTDAPPPDTNPRLVVCQTDDGPIPSFILDDTDDDEDDPPFIAYDGNGRQPFDFPCPTEQSFGFQPIVVPSTPLISDYRSVGAVIAPRRVFEIIDPEDCPRCALCTQEKAAAPHPRSPPPATQ